MLMTGTRGSKGDKRGGGSVSAAGCDSTVILSSGKPKAPSLAAGRFNYSSTNVHAATECTEGQVDGELAIQVNTTQADDLRVRAIGPRAGWRDYDVGLTVAVKIV